MIATLCFFNNEFTVLTLSKMQAVLQKVNFLLITISFMFFQKAFRTKLPFASPAYNWLMLNKFNDSLAIFFRTVFEGMVLGCFIKVVDFNILLFNLLCEIMIKFTFLVHKFITLLFWTDNLLEHFDLESNIIPNTVFTVHVITFAQMNEVLLFYHPQTYFACYFLLFEL